MSSAQYWCICLVLWYIYLRICRKTEAPSTYTGVSWHKSYSVWEPYACTTGRATGEQDTAFCPMIHKWGNSASWPELPHLHSALSMSEETRPNFIFPYETYPCVESHHQFLSFLIYNTMIRWVIPLELTFCFLVNFASVAETGTCSICNMFSLILFTTVPFQSHRPRHISS